MNDNELARIYFDHHAQETDRRSQHRLTELMRKAIEHDGKCTTPQCAIKLRSFLHGDALTRQQLDEEFHRLGLPEDDMLRQAAVARIGFVVRVYYPRHGVSVTGVMK